MLSEALEAQGVFPGVYTTAILATRSKKKPAANK